MSRKSIPILVILLLLLVAAVFTLREPDTHSAGSERGNVAADSLAPEAEMPAPIAKKKRPEQISPPSWKPAQVFARIGKPTPAHAFPRGENATRRYHETVTRVIDPELATQKPSVLAKLPEDGRFHLLPEEIDEHTLVAGRLVFDPSSVDRVVNGEVSRILAPTLTDEVLTLEFQKIKTRSANTHTLQGHVVGEESTSIAQIVYHDGILHGSVMRYDSQQEIEYRILADGHMMVRELDHTAMTDHCATCSGDVLASIAEEDPAIDEGEYQIENSGEAISMDTSGWRTLDVVVGYGQEARIAQGGYAQMEARIIDAVDQVTLAFANSGIADAELMLLGTIEDPDYRYSEVVTTGMAYEISALRTTDGTDGGLLDTVTDFTDQLGADLSSFVILAGRNGVTGVQSKEKYTVISRTGMGLGQMTFAHEIGHCLGAGHAWGDSNNDVVTSNYAWRFKAPDDGKNYRTIISYNEGIGGTTIPYYSNPEIFYKGARTGAFNGHNVLNDTTADPLFYEDKGIRGFDGSNPALGANNAAIIDAGDPAKKHGLAYNSAHAIRTDFEVINPIAAARWEKGTIETIKFNGGDMEDLATIKLYKGGMLHSTLAVGVNPATHRNFAWTIPFGLPDASDYMIRVELDRNGSTLTADSGIFEIFSNLPNVNTASAPAVPAVIGQVSSLILTFNVPMNPATFDVGTDIVSFLNPEGTSMLGSITGTTWSAGDTVLTIQFTPPSLQGSYQMVIGPDIEDTAGNGMDQDGDGTMGEIIEDRYTTTFHVNPPLPYYASMDTDPGWTFSANNPGAGWAFGQPTGGSGQSPETNYSANDYNAGYGIADPTSGFNGPNVIGYNLTGDYERGITSTRWATTPAMDCSDYENVRLRFQRWLGVYFGGGISGDNVYIEVSNDGTNWTPVWHNNSSQFNTAAWTEVEYDISSVADGQATVFVRWGMGKTNSSFNNDSCGWNIDEVVVHGDYLDSADNTPPYPSPMSFASGPTAQGVSAVTMTATTALDANGVEYYFDETSGNPGGSDSGWQDSPTYIDTGLLAGTQYTYTVKARDKSPAQNETSVSAPASATTDAGPTLTLIIAAGSIGESDGPGATTATVSRNTDTGSSLVVNLSSNDTTEATVPATVTIAAGQSVSPVFSVNAVDDAIVDGTQSVTLTATAAGHANGSDTIDVTDDLPLTLTMITGTNGESASGGGPKDPDGSPFAITATPATGYSFGQWTVISGEVSFDNANSASTTVDTTGDATVQANFVVGSFTVTYAGNGSDGGAVPVDVSSPYDYNSTVTVQGNAGSLTRTGHSFAGWNTASDGSGTGYVGGNSFNIATDITLHAQWTPETYTITYEGNGNTGGTVPDSQTKTYGEALTLATNSGDLVKSGSTFDGWNSADDGSGTDYTEGGTFAPDADTILYAKWNSQPTVDAGPDQTVYLPVAAPWSPGDIPLAAWYDASDAGTITQSGGAVSKWEDKTVNARHATQNTATARPTSGARTLGGKNVIEFPNTSSQSLVIPTIDVIGKEVWSVFVIDDNLSTASQLLLGGGGNVQIGVNSSTQKFRLWAATNPYSADTTSTATAPQSAPTVGGWLAHTDTKKFSINGTLETTTNTYVSSRTLNATNIGRGQHAVMDGAIGEIIITNGALSTDDRQRMEGYLAHKWGLAGNLPEAHPYKAAAPGSPPAVATLDATVSDPEGNSMTQTWTKTGGPATDVNFDDSTAVDTNAYFTEVGTYTLRLSVDDGFQQAYDEVEITVALPPLGVSIADGEISEDGGTTTATISRIGTAGDLQVTLSSSDTGEATVPATVTIPNGSSSVDVTITGVPDGISDGTQLVTITAAAAGFANGVDTVNVTDADADDYASWIAGYTGLGGLTAFDDDADGDGIRNGIENYFGTHPGEFSQGVVAGAVSANTFAFTHPLNESPASNISAGYRWSKDLVNFHADGATHEGITVSFIQGEPVEGMVTVTATITGTTMDRLFVDIEVTEAIPD